MIPSKPTGTLCEAANSSAAEVLSIMSSVVRSKGWKDPPWSDLYVPLTSAENILPEWTRVPNGSTVIPGVGWSFRVT